MIADPPRLAVWLLRLVLPPERYETITGDLEEKFRLDVQPHAGPGVARRWYWRQALSIAIARMLARGPCRCPSHRHDKVIPCKAFDRTFVTRCARSSRRPTFTAIAVVTLALGIGANTAIFTLVNGLLLKPLPFAQPDELMMVHLLMPDRDGGPGVFREMVWSYPEVRGLPRRAAGVLGACALHGQPVEPDRQRRARTPARRGHRRSLSDDAWRDVRSSAATSPLDEDRTPGMDGIVMLGHALWQRRFGGDPNVLGTVIRLNGAPYTVVGVLPPGFRGLTGEAEALVPLMTLPAEALESEVVALLLRGGAAQARRLRRAGAQTR